MTDLLAIATRLEAACDITGKPIGRHMVPGMTKLAEMQTAIGASEDDREAGELGEVTACMTACIDNEAKLFDALAAVAKEAVEALRAAAKPLDVKGLAEMLGTSEDDVRFTSIFHQAYDMGAKAHASYSAGYVDAERDIMEYMIEAGEVAIREDISRCEHRPQAVSDLLCLRTQTVPEGEPSFECMAYDAHCPSMTVRFQVPEGFPLAGGIFRVQRVRTATPDDTARFAHLPDAPEAI